ncbi:MAG: hypothetical protein IKF19_00040 [Bacilli bacterium]|nr:hypothetical protein [Bacilli bacterium]
MDNNMFNVSPFSEKMNSIYPKDKGILLFYANGDVKELYGREHVMMMQEIGYWYVDNWQDFLLNYSYNGVIVVVIEFDTSLVYLPKNISIKQKESFIDYIQMNVSKNNIDLLEFFVMRCLEENNDTEEFSGIKRNNRGMIKNVSGMDITQNTSFGYIDLCNYLNTMYLEKKNILNRI